MYDDRGSIDKVSANRMTVFSNEVEKLSSVVKAMIQYPPLIPSPSHPAMRIHDSEERHLAGEEALDREL
jgi:hypothetical protein